MSSNHESGFCEADIKDFLQAARRGDAVKCKEMLDLGMPAGIESNHDFDHQMGYGTAWHAALTNGHLNVAEMLADHGVNIHQKDRYNQTVGSRAAHSMTEDGFQSLKWLVDRFGTGFSGINNATMLHCACDLGQLRSVELLLAAGCDPNARSDSLHTPLHYACGRESKAFMTALLEAGADPSVRTQSNLLPLHFLAYPETILTAHALGWDLDTPGRRDMTLMQMLDRNKNEAAIRSLLALGYSNRHCYGITNAIEEILERSPFVNAVDTRNTDILMAHLDRFGLPTDDQIKAVKAKLNKNPEMKSMIDALKAKNRIMSIAQGARSSLTP